MRSLHVRNRLVRDIGRAQPETVIQHLLFLASQALTLTLPGGTRRFLREMRKYLAQMPGKPKIKPRQLSRALYYVKKRKLIRMREQGSAITLELTEKGKQRWLSYTLLTLKVQRQERWDGQWRLVLFDIPEWQKVAREALREKLKQLGFLQFQKSVWIFPYPCQDEIDFLAELFSIGQHLTLLTVKIEDDDPLRSQFKL